jgi:hypothetical protein
VCDTGFFLQILRNDDVNKPFKSFIGDFSQADMTVFNRKQVTHWKPVMLVSRTIVQYLLYMTIQRSGSGEWYLQVRTFSPDSLLSKIKVKLEVFRTEGAAAAQPGKQSTTFSYEGSVVSSKLSNEEAVATGKFLMLADPQMKCLKTEDTIFEYRVNVMVDHNRGEGGCCDAAAAAGDANAAENGTKCKSACTAKRKEEDKTGSLKRQVVIE